MAKLVLESKTEFAHKMYRKDEEYSAKFTKECILGLLERLDEVYYNVDNGKDCCDDDIYAIGDALNFLGMIKEIEFK